MSKVMKGMIINEYRARLGEHEDAMLISIRGVSGIDTTALRTGLAKKGIRISVVRNALFRPAFEGTKLEKLHELMVGQNAIAFGGESVVNVAREIVELVQKYPGIELKGAVLDGELFSGEEGVKRLSKFPTRDEAIAQDVALILGPARKLMAAVKGPGSTIAGIIKTIEDKLEKGEAIAKVG
ncbi:MAG: 50S ribosomal protein L10 [Phycisphaerales bacterium]|jgi:large subunit ribosomal protein L10|nr:50S ribosomal protein L10 [Phycisphaerales bacterium]